MSRVNLDKLQKRADPALTDLGVKETATEIFSSVSQTRKPSKDYDAMLNKIIKRRPEGETNEGVIDSTIKDLGLRDKQEFDQFDELHKFLAKNEVQLRHLHVLKQCFKLDENGHHAESMPIESVKDQVDKIFGQFRKHAEIAGRLMTHLVDGRDVNDADIAVPYARLDALVEFVKH